MLRLRLKEKISLIIAGLVGFSVLLFSSLTFLVIQNSKQGNKLSDLIVNKLSSDLQTYFFTIGIVVLLITVVVVIIFSNSFLNSIHTVNQGLSLLEKGILPEELNVKANDEIGEIATRVNNISKNLQDTSSYTIGIGQGVYQESFQPLSEGDVLRNSLIQMTTSVREADQREKERAWVINGIAEVGNILRDSSTVETLSESITKYFVSRINSIQGAFYVTALSKEETKSELNLVYTYAYNRKKYVQNKFQFGEGLIGQSAIEMTSIFRTEIPDDYCTITSGILGDAKPSCIFILPLITDEKVYGVLEFASFHKFTPTEIKFLEEAGPSIARTIFNIQVNEQTKQHLEESTRMSNELQVQQEELRQNAEEMQATQEELKKSNYKLEEQIEEVQKAQYRMQSLLENASEVITIFEETGNIKYVSPSVKNILGYDENELVGTNKLDKVHEEEKGNFDEAFKFLLSSNSTISNMQFRYKQKNGEWIWLEATGRNMLQDKAVSGIVMNSRDITLKRKAEIEERMRRNMQALSENSPDLITRISNDGKIVYTNPTIKLYTGNEPEELINKYLDELHIENSLLGSWKSVLEDVKEKKENLSLEMTYHLPMGERVMQVNAIPEYNEGIMETILVVSHDVTERKHIELEIKEKNKNINESINYSKRIQNAILPDTKLIQQIFPQSFILYKPRDVVSGDFPWFNQTGDNIHIAVVDCTGHGVPGAMLSLVGYFQLNNIVEGNHDLDTGKILDMLDQKVNDTLIKGMGEENIKDGMDIAFCKINLKKKQIEYSGAHRPLYYINKEGLQELKGNRWAIGGGVYKNQSSFTTYKMDFKKGDAVFFFSDGLPDQFGGPENRKLGTSRIKAIIQDNPKADMNEMYQIFSNEFDNWKKGYKQTDDVLLIGIKF